MRHRLLACLVTAAACDPRPPQPKFEPMSDVKTLMAAVVEPAAEVYWDAVGSWDDSTGTHSIVPTTDSAWTAVQAAAITVGESGNLLMIPPRAVDQGEWMTLSRAMTTASREALSAAIARDTSRVFTAGALLYDACTACHAKYATQVMRPNAK